MSFPLVGNDKQKQNAIMSDDEAADIQVEFLAFFFFFYGQKDSSGVKAQQ